MNSCVQPLNLLWRLREWGECWIHMIFLGGKHCAFAAKQKKTTATIVVSDLFIVVCSKRYILYFLLNLLILQWKYISQLYLKYLKHLFCSASCIHALLFMFRSLECCKKKTLIKFFWWLRLSERICTHHNLYFTYTDIVTIKIFYLLSCRVFVVLFLHPLWESHNETLLQSETNLPCPPNLYCRFQYSVPYWNNPYQSKDCFPLQRDECSTSLSHIIQYFL